LPSDQFSITKAVIPAAGHGTRLRPITNVMPKELLPLGVKPTLQHIVEELHGVGVTDIIFVISPQKGSIREYFGSIGFGGKVRFSYVIQEVQRGLADAVLRAEAEVAGEHFIVALGDTVIISESGDLPLKRLVAAYQSNPAFAAIIVERVPIRDSYKYGMVKPRATTGAAFEIDGVIEKPNVGESPSDYAIGGRYIFDPGVFDWIRRTPVGALGEQQITDTVRVALEAGERVWCVPVQEGEHRYDIGDFSVYCEAFIMACMTDPNLSPVVQKLLRGQK